MSGLRFSIFLTVVLSIWALMHAYVFWRLASIPWVERHFSRSALVTIGILLWLSYVVARTLTSRWHAAWPLELFSANWMGVLFLILAALLVVEVVTLGGFLFRAHVPTLRGGAVIVAALLAVVALIQGARPPVVTDYEVTLPELPRSRDGLTLIAVSDVHLGTLIGERWLSRLVTQVNALRPDLVVVVGDLVDSHVDHAERVLPILRQLRAPLGVWAVTGNHEFYADYKDSVRLMREAGFEVLQDQAQMVVPGLVLAGVDDLTARRQFRLDDDPVTKVLSQRPPGATVFLTHTPWHAEKAAAHGVGLWLAGHTHGGQIWPFTYLVAGQHRYVAGRYDVNGMTAIVCRGTGTWGPRMRLWQPSEILRIRLRAP